MTFVAAASGKDTDILVQPEGIQFRAFQCYSRQSCVRGTCSALVNNARIMNPHAIDMS